MTDDEWWQRFGRRVAFGCLVAVALLLVMMLANCGLTMPMPSDGPTLPSLVTTTTVPDTTRGPDLPSPT